MFDVHEFESVLKKPDIRRDYCSVRDATGLTHAAHVVRVHDPLGSLSVVQVYTVCHPQMVQWSCPHTSVGTWGRHVMPVITAHDGPTYVEYFLREVPTCLVCSNASINPFGSEWT